jgi:hypothetical protein
MRWRLIVLFLVLLGSGCRDSDVLPRRETERIGLSRFTHVTRTEMIIYLRNPGPYRLSNLTFEVEHWNSQHTALYCHTVAVACDIEPEHEAHISLPLEALSHRCDRDSTIPKPLTTRVLDIWRLRNVNSQVCAIADDSAWQWALVSIRGKLANK